MDILYRTQNVASLTAAVISREHRTKNAERSRCCPITILPAIKMSKMKDAYFPDMSVTTQPIMVVLYWALASFQTRKFQRQLYYL